MVMLPYAGTSWACAAGTAPSAVTATATATRSLRMCAPVWDGGRRIAAAHPTTRTERAFLTTGAGDENRTRVTSLEDWSSTIELRPRRNALVSRGAAGRSVVASARA